MFCRRDPVVGSRSFYFRTQIRTILFVYPCVFHFECDGAMPASRHSARGTVGMGLVRGVSLDHHVVRPWFQGHPQNRGNTCQPGTNRPSRGIAWPRPCTESIRGRDLLRPLELTLPQRMERSHHVPLPSFWLHPRMGTSASRTVRLFASSSGWDPVAGVRSGRNALARGRARACVSWRDAQEASQTIPGRILLVTRLHANRSRLESMALVQTRYGCCLPFPSGNRIDWDA